jgi:hypothetical protein
VAISISLGEVYPVWKGGALGLGFGSQELDQKNVIALKAAQKPENLLRNR